MAIRIQRNENGNCITFIGSSNPVYFNACLSAEVDPNDSTLVNVINDIHTANSGIKEYEFYNIPHSEWRDADNNTFADAQAVADYITLNGNVAFGANINADYLGVWDASTNTPDITATSPVSGSWFYISVAGDIDPNTGLTSSPTVNYLVNDIVKYDDTSSTWQRVPNETVRVDQLQQEVEEIVYSTESALFNTNDAVYADGDRASSDPNNLESGWYYKNLDSSAAGKINWYYVGNVNPQNTMTLATMKSMYAVIKVIATGVPHFSLYTQPQGDGNDQAVWYRSHLNYVADEGVLDAYVGQQVLLYWGEDPSTKFLTIPHIELELDLSTSNGFQATDENVLFGALSTSSNTPEGTYEFIAKTLGFKNNTHITEYLLDTNDPVAAVATTDVGSNETIDFTRDATNTSVIFGHTGASQGVNTIVATLRDDGTITIKGIGDNQTGTHDHIHYITNINHSNVTITGSAPNSQTPAGVVNALNALFTVNPLGAGYEPATILPTLAGAATTYNLQEGNTPVTGTPTHLYTTGADTGSGHGARMWTNETIDEAGEFFDVKVTGGNGARFILGLVNHDDTTTLAELSNDSGNGHSGLTWGNAFYDYGSYSAPWTTYGRGQNGVSMGLSHGPGWTGSTDGMMRYNTEVQDNLDNVDAVLFRVGINDQGYIYVSYYDAGRTNDFIMTARTSHTAQAGNYGLVVKLWSGNATLVEAPTRSAVDPVAPVMAYRYIESPDSSFHYPLFATEEEAHYYDTQEGGSGISHTHVYVDEPTLTTWYMPDTNSFMDAASAPSNTSEITYTEIPTEADSLYAPTQYTDNTTTVDEGDSLNIQVAPQGSSWSTSVSGLPSGLAFDGYSLIQGAAPTVTGDNVANPSDTYTITVSRTNSYGTSTGTLTLVVNNTTAPSVAPTGFTLVSGEMGSGTLMGNPPTANDAVAELDLDLEPGKRYVFPKTWVEANILPYVDEDGNDVFVGVPETSVDWSDVGTGDFDAMFKMEGATSTSHVSKIKVDPLSGDAYTINSPTNAFYDYALEWDGKDLHVIACKVADINTQPGVSNGGNFSRVMTYSNYNAVRTGDLPVVVAVDNGGQINLDVTGVNVIDLPYGDRDILVSEVSETVAQFDVGNGPQNSSAVTLNAGYTYRFMLNNASVESGDTLSFVLASDGTTAYTTGVSTVGSHGDYLYYVEFQVPSDVPPLKVMWNGNDQGVVNTSGSTYVTPVTGITLEGPTANQTGTNVMDAGDHGWISLDEQLSAGERLVLDNAFFDDFLAETKGNNTIFAIGLKGNNWANTTEINSNGAGAAVQNSETFRSNTYIVGIWSSSASNLSMWIFADGVGSNMFYMNSLSLYPTTCAFLEITSDGNNIRAGMGRNNSTGNITQGDESTVAYADWNAYKKETVNRTLGISSIDVVMSFWTYDGGAIDGNNIDWTGLSEVSVPTPAATLTTNWNKALDFSGSSERTQMVNSSYLYNPLNMGNISSTTSIPVGTTYSSNDTNARPWATAVVFSSDNNSSNQHIWNNGEGAGSTGDNIYVRVDSSRNLYFGWGRTGALNECSLGTLSASAGTWYGLYIAHNGTRLSGSHSSGQIASHFDIHLVNLSTGVAGSNLSTASNWTSGSFGARMDRQFTGSITIGGRGSNRNFHGKVAAMVSTTLMRNAVMPTDAEISMMVRDPMQWLTDYRVGQTYRHSSGTTTSTFALSSLDSSYATQVWLMGDGTSDAYAQIRNQVVPGTQNNTPMNMISMVSNDIETVNIIGLT